MRKAVISLACTDAWMPPPGERAKRVCGRAKSKGFFLPNLLLGVEAMLQFSFGRVISGSNHVSQGSAAANASKGE